MLLLAVYPVHNWDIESMTCMGTGLIIVFSLWIYFDKIDGSVIRVFRDHDKMGLYIIWLYAHFPLVIGLCATADGIRHLISTDQSTILPYLDQWLICGSVALCLFSIGVIHLFMSNPSGEKKLLMRLSFYRFMVGFATLPILLILIKSMICIIQILLDLKHHPHQRIF